MNKAVVLLSGGLDSATALAIARTRHRDIYTLSFAYGQRHDLELRRAFTISKRSLANDHTLVHIDLRAIGGSALTANIDVPKGRSDDEMGAGVPVTYVPARNTIFLSYALAYAESIGAHDIYIGVNALDYSGYPDCRPEFIAAFQAMADLATKAGIEGSGPRIHAPLIGMTKAQIIAEGTRLGVDYKITSSCYDPDERGRACGECDSCQLRLKGFAENGTKDLIEYR